MHNYCAQKSALYLDWSLTGSHVDWRMETILYEMFKVNFLKETRHYLCNLIILKFFSLKPVLMTHTGLNVYFNIVKFQVFI